MSKYNDVWAIYGRKSGTRKRASVLGYMRGTTSRAKAMEAAKKVAPKGYIITGVKPYKELGKLARLDVKYSAFFGGIARRAKDVM